MIIISSGFAGLPLGSLCCAALARALVRSFVRSLARSLARSFVRSLACQLQQSDGRPCRDYLRQARRRRVWLSSEMHEFLLGVIERLPSLGSRQTTMAAVGQSRCLRASSPSVMTLQGASTCLTVGARAQVGRRPPKQQLLLSRPTRANAIELHRPVSEPPSSTCASPPAEQSAKREQLAGESLL